MSKPSDGNDLWNIFWEIESEASAMNNRADDLLERTRYWRLIGTTEPKPRPRADWRDLFENDGYEVEEPDPPAPESEPDQGSASAQHPARRQRPATFASTIKPDAPSDPTDLTLSDVTGSFRNVVYGIDTQEPASRLRDLLDKRSFDRLWTAGEDVDADTFATFFAAEGFASAEGPDADAIDG